MAVIVLVARLVLAGVFVTAALAKLADRRGARQAVAAFGVPTRLAGPLGVLLPLVELAVGAALVPAASARWGAAAALGLLVVFVVAIGANLARGKRPDCRCFGQLHSAPVGWLTLVRNGALAALAGIVVWRGGEAPGGVAWLAELTAPGWVALVAGLAGMALVGLQGWAVVNLLRQHGRLLLRIDALEAAIGQAAPAARQTPSSPPVGLPVGAVAPGFRLSGLFGETLTLDALLAGGVPAMLVFTDPNCGPCAALLPDVARWQRDHAGAINIALISRGDQARNRAKAAEAGVHQVLVQEGDEVADAYHASGTPSALIVDAEAKVASPLAVGADAIRALLARTLGRPAPIPVAAANGNGHNGNGAAHTHRHDLPQTPQIGQPAPAVALPDVSGTTRELAEFRGRETVVLFWNPRCGFCSDMLADLQGWEADPPDGSPMLVVISTGAAEDNAAMGLRSPVLLDQTSRAMQMFGANGTPMAVRLDPEGRFASELAVGKQGVLALLHGRVGSTHA